MARNRFVDGERLHLVLRTRLELVRVRHEVAGAGRFERALTVVGGRRGRRLEVGSWDDAVGSPRQSTEELDELGVDPLADVAVTPEQLVGRPVIEARIGPQDRKSTRLNSSHRTIS